MVALTYGDALVPSADTAVKAAPKTAPKTAPMAAPRKHWFVRFFEAMIAARMKQAEREIRMYTRLMPYTVDEHGNRQLKTEMTDTPRGGW